jgi:hypothetical protein
MNAMNGRILGLVLGLGMAAASFFGPAALLPKAAAQALDPRLLYIMDNGNNRYIKDMGNGRWAEYNNGKLLRFHKEVGRTDKFVELFTDDPIPTASRLFNSGITWRGANEVQWRAGSTGGWKDPALFIP